MDVLQTHGCRETGLHIVIKRHCRVVASLILFVVAFVFLMVCPVPAPAEWFGDVYGGIALPESTTAQFDQRLPSSLKTATKLDLDASPTGGVRGGYWFGKPSVVSNWFGSPLVGLAGDVSYFQRNALGAKLDVVPLSLLLMLRLPLLKSDAFPRGQLQPYMGIGPSFFVAQAELDSPAPGIDAVHRGRTDFGFDVRAGFMWQVHKRVALFLEYRFTDVTLRMLDRQCFQSFCGPLQTEIVSETRVKLATNHLLIGIRF